MNVEFHYYSTAFLAVKAGFSLDEAETIAFAGQYVDHHHRTYEISTPGGTIISRPTQNYSFWDPATVVQVLEPFHFFPAGLGTDRDPVHSVRTDGARSVRDVRPNSPPAKELLVAALRTKDLYRIGLALHTFSDTWAHQNFTARDEAWNRLAPGSRLPSPGHAQAGWAPDQWHAVWTDPRLTVPQVVNLQRFADCARKVYRYLCTFKGKDFKRDEEQVAAELGALVEGGRDRETTEDRTLGYVMTLGLAPYEKERWLTQALEPAEEGPSPWPALDPLKKVGAEILDRTGLTPTQRVRAKPKFGGSPLAAWIRAAEEHRSLARSIIARTTAD